MILIIIYKLSFANDNAPAERAAVAGGLRRGPRRAAALYLYNIIIYIYIYIH